MKKCNFLTPDGALVQILTTRWRFFKTNCEKSIKIDLVHVLATRGRFFSFFLEKMQVLPGFLKILEKNGPFLRKIVKNRVKSL